MYKLLIKTMKTISLKRWANATASIEVNEKDEIFVSGYFYDGYKKYPGPVVGPLGILPGEDMDAKLFSSFCEEIYKKAKAAEPWFNY